MPPPADQLLVLRSGAARLETQSGYSEMLASGSHIGASIISSVAASGAQLRFIEHTEAYRFSAAALETIPVVRWKLLETWRRRYTDN